MGAFWSHPRGAVDRSWFIQLVWICHLRGTSQAGSTFAFRYLACPNLKRPMEQEFAQEVKELLRKGRAIQFSHGSGPEPERMTS